MLTQRASQPAPQFEVQGQEICYTKIYEAFMRLQMAIVVAAWSKHEVVVNSREVRDQVTMFQVCNDIPHFNLWIEACEIISVRDICVDKTCCHTSKWF